MSRLSGGWAARLGSLFLAACLAPFAQTTIGALSCNIVNNLTGSAASVPNCTAGYNGNYYSYRFGAGANCYNCYTQSQAAPSASVVVNVGLGPSGPCQSIVGIVFYGGTVPGSQSTVPYVYAEGTATVGGVNMGVVVFDGLDCNLNSVVGPTPSSQYSCD